MTLTELLMAQLLDPFRIGLIVALVATMHRTEAVTGRAIPLAAGVVFVALIVPLTLQGFSGGALWQAVWLGLIANALILAVVLAARQALLRLLRR